MTQIAILADIHGNVPALQAVIADIEQRQPDEIIVAGDLVGRGPQGSLVIDIIQDMGWPSVRGNHEDYLINFARKNVPEDWLTSTYWEASRWMAAELSDAHVEYIDALPMTYTSRIDPRVVIGHGSPTSNTEGVYDWTETETLQKHLASIQGDVFVCAHTHRPLIRRLEEGIIVNVGSVGLPFNRDPRAQYAILNQTDEGWDVELVQVEYDRERFLDIYQTSGFLQAGGFTSLLLTYEIKHACPFLVPFLRWGELTHIKPTVDDVDTFLSFYDHTKSMAELKEVFSALKAKNSEQ